MKKENTSKKPGDLLSELIEKVKLRFDKISNNESSFKQSPDKWSQKEILGHLIDSASINHQRFVRIMFQNDLIFPGYEQDNWVNSQKYNSIEWRDLVNLWYYLNLHISRVMNSVPDEILNRKHHKHNLNEIAWKVIPPEKPATLDYFMRDYIGHLNHHLDQLFRVYTIDH